MALSSVDLVYYYTDTGSTTDTTTSLGETINANTIPSDTANNFFDDVTGDESTAGDIEYRCFAFKNTSDTYDYINCKAWITGCVRAAANKDTIGFALQDPDGGTVQNPADESTGPNSTAFTVPVGGGSTCSWTFEDGTDDNPSATLTYGTLPFGSFCAIWFRRDVPAGAAAYSNRATTIQWQGETTGSPLETLTHTFVLSWGSEGLSVFSDINATTS